MYFAAYKAAANAKMARKTFEHDPILNSHLGILESIRKHSKKLQELTQCDRFFGRICSHFLSLSLAVVHREVNVILKERERAKCVTNGEIAF